MIEIKNKIGNKTKVFAQTFEYEAYGQVKALANYEPYLNSKIRIMPDAHAGKGCTVGTTMKLNNAVTPNLVGVDIGCGMHVVELKQTSIDLKELDRVINKHIPSGFSIHENPIGKFDLSELICHRNVDLERASLSIGTLGGGNHFIEIDKDKNDTLYLVIHSGSRNIGVQVCKFYQDLAFKSLNEVGYIKQKLVEELKRDGREKDIQDELKKIRKPSANKELAHLTGKLFEDYIHDMEIIQSYANTNRITIANIILDHCKLRDANRFTTVHNYIDTNRMILRKGAVSAENEEKLIIPMNMRDGSLICIGKGNEDWNFSAPHGAGRLMSRSKAKENIHFEDFSNSMKGIYSTSVCQSTIDESPQVYKPMDEIIDCIKETVNVDKRIKPIYNFKAH